MSGADDVAEATLPVRVIEHDGVIISDKKGLTEDERGFARWMDDHVPADVEAELTDEDG